MKDFSQIMETVQSIVTTLAIFIGGGWAYLRFIMRREHVWNLEMNIST